MGKIIEHLKKKPVNVMITNACNLSCAGCSQHCGLFPKEKYFFIKEDQFKFNIKIACQMSKHVHLFGGEACLHPAIEDFLKICEKDHPENYFFIWTNGKYKKYKEGIVKTSYTGSSYHHSIYKNILVQVDLKEEDRKFISTLIAPQDIIFKKSKRQFFEEYAQNHCNMYKNCHILFYDKFAYACECAGSFDKITEFDKGWIIQENFLESISDEDVINQLSNFCYRCGHCIPKNIREKFFQSILKKPLCSTTNKDITKKEINTIDFKKLKIL